MFERLSFPVSGMINDEWSSDDVDMFRTAHHEWICKCLDGLMDDEALCRRAELRVKNYNRLVQAPKGEIVAWRTHRFEFSLPPSPSGSQPLYFLEPVEWTAT